MNTGLPDPSITPAGAFEPSDENLIGELRVVLARRADIGVAAACPADSLIGRRLGHYEIRERLGEGGMARVYRAADLDAPREVALKLLLPEYQGRDDVRARFEQEALSMARVRHDNVVRIYDCPKDADLTAIAMELVSGGSLRDLIETGRRQSQRFTVDAVVRFARQAALGLGAAHRAGIVHRDIKPANLMLDESCNVKVADFGVVLALERATWLTGLGRQIGTPAYMSPEQCRGERVGPASDVYSLGVTLYELATGRLPFSEDAGSPFAIMLKHIHEMPPDPRTYRDAMPKWLVWVLLKCLDKDPQDRYPDGDALAEALVTAPNEPDLEETDEGPKTVWRGNPVAIREQLKQLPQRAIVAWACRCARRVQHLNTDPRLDRSIAMAESTAFGPAGDAPQESLTHALQRVQQLRTASFRAAYTGGPAKKQDPASYAALAAAASGACAAARCAEDAAADAAFVAQNAVTALELAEGPVSEFWQWAQRDYQHLVTARLGEKGTVGRPIPPGFWQERT